MICLGKFIMQYVLGPVLVIPELSLQGEIMHNQSSSSNRVKA